MYLSISHLRNLLCSGLLSSKSLCTYFSFPPGLPASQDFKKPQQTNACSSVGWGWGGGRFQAVVTCISFWQLHEDSVSKQLLCKVPYFLEWGSLFFNLEITLLKSRPTNTSFQKSQYHHSSNYTINSSQSYFYLTEGLKTRRNFS